MTACLESTRQSKMDPVHFRLDTYGDRPPAHVASETAPQRVRSQSPTLGIGSIQKCLTPGEDLD